MTMKITTTKSHYNGYSETHTIFEDYFKTVAASNIKRATEKSVHQAHEKALELLPSHLEAVYTQYKLES